MTAIIDSIIKVLKLILYFLLRHFGFFIALLFIVILSYTAYIYYEYIFLPVNSNESAPIKQVRLSEERFGVVVKILNERNKNISESMSKQYKNYFQ